MTLAKSLPKIVVRLPEDVKQWLRDEARRNASSQNSEAVRSIRERMDRQAGGVTTPVAVVVEG